MSEKIKKLWETMKERLKKVSKKAYIIIGVVVVVLAAALAFALNNKPYSVLFTGVSPSEASSILSFLEGQGITDYKVENNDHSGPQGEGRRAEGTAGDGGLPPVRLCLFDLL